MAGAEARKVKLPKPNIFAFHDYRELLQEWLKYLKQVVPTFSLRQLALRAQLSPAYLSLVIKGKRSLSEKNCGKLIKHLRFDASEKAYFKALRILGEARDQDSRQKAYKKIQRFQRYRQQHPAEFEVHHYLDRWYFVAIRELAALPNFEDDPKWIQSQLSQHVPLIQIQKALVFLKKFGFIVPVQGGWKAGDKDVHCLGGVFQLALAEFHREMLNLASSSIDDTDKDNRELLGYTFALNKENFHKVKDILLKAQREIAALERQNKNSDQVYHVELSAFPLSKEPA